MKILWKEEGLQFGFVRWKEWAASKVLWEWIPNVGSKAREVYNMSVVIPKQPSFCYVIIVCFAQHYRHPQVFISITLVSVFLDKFCTPFSWEHLMWKRHLRDPIRSGGLNWLKGAEHRSKHTKSWKEHCLFNIMTKQHANFGGRPIFQATKQHLNNS